MAMVVLDHVSKQCEGLTLVNDLSLTVDDQEFIALVGPMGCGHTAVLRLIAGLDEPTSGRIVIGDHLLHRYGIATLAELNPRVTVYQNIAEGLKLERWPRAQLDTRVRELADELELHEVLDIRPKELTYRQRLRVAVGATVITNPRVVLMNQPLASFCGLLKDQLRQELARLMKRFGSTVIYATHDVTEAMALADRVVVMRDGAVLQVDRPQTVYQEPFDLFVARFMGSPPSNFITALLVQEERKLYLSQGLLRLAIPEDRRQQLLFYIGREVVVGIRPEQLALASGAEVREDRTLKAKVELAEFLGAETMLHLRVGPFSLVARVHPIHRIMPGEWVNLVIDVDNVHLFDKQTERRIT